MIADVALPLSCSRNVRAILDALGALVAELHGVIAALTPEQYARKPVGPVQSSVGGHVRHTLDHLETLLDARLHEEFTYDQRCRGTAVETDRGAALVKLEELLARISTTSEMPDDAPVLLSARVAAEDAPVAVETTLARELLFVFSHTVHHNALIRVMVELMGGSVPERFGYAPSTLAFLGRRACAH